MKTAIPAVSLLFLVLAPTSLQAATYVPMNDDALLGQAALVVEAEVLDSGPSPVSARVATDTLVQVHRLLKGEAPGSHLVVRVVGGTGPDGLSLHVAGAPRFRLGERVLLFLTPLADGTYVPTQLFLGVFRRQAGAGSFFAMRDLDEARAVPLPVGIAAPDETGLVRSFDAFADWIAARARGESRVADYFVPEPPPSSLEAITGSFTLFESGGHNIRWTEFDSASSVGFRAHQDGQPGMTGGGFAEIQQGLAAWTADAGSNISYTYLGTTTATGGLTTFDGINAIVFDDPNSHPTFGGAFSCAVGGVLAIGGPWFNTMTTHMHDGDTFITIAGADVVTNQNVACFFNGNGGADGAEVFAHELGHTLGINHACGDAGSGPCSTSTLDEALMRADAHGDGRGADLRTDDEAAVCFLYGLPGCEVDVIFQDGFESGNTSAWDTTVS